MEELVYQQRLYKEKQEKAKLIQEKLSLQEEIEELKFVNAKIIEKIKKDYKDQFSELKQKHAEELSSMKATIQQKAENTIHRIIEQYTQKSSLLATQHQALEKQLEKQYERELSILAQKKLTAEMNMKHLHKELLECKRIISDLRKKLMNHTAVF